MHLHHFANLHMKLHENCIFHRNNKSILKIHVKQTNSNKFANYFNLEFEFTYAKQVIGMLEKLYGNLPFQLQPMIYRNHWIFLEKNKSNYTTTKYKHQTAFFLTCRLHFAEQLFQTRQADKIPSHLIVYFKIDSYFIWYCF